MNQNQNQDQKQNFNQGQQHPSSQETNKQSQAQGRETQQSKPKMTRDTNISGHDTSRQFKDPIAGQTELDEDQDEIQEVPQGEQTTLNSSGVQEGEKSRNAEEMDEEEESDRDQKRRSA